MRFVGLTMAKGTSFRLPRKNLLMFAGRPLLEWTLIAMKASRYMTDYFIVTESEEIAELAYRYGFEVVWQTQQSAAEAGHYGAPVCEQIFFKGAGGHFRDDDVLVSVLPTSPCRKPQDLDVVIGRYLQVRMEHPNSTINVIPMVRLKDMHLLEKADKTMRVAVFDNQGKYYHVTGTGGARGMGYARGMADEVPAIMEAFRKGTHYAGFSRDPDIIECVEHEVWQEWDIDSRADFEMCERLFVTNGLGDDAYRRYRGGV